MAYDSLSLSQPLYGGGYNQYLLAKMQNKDNPQSGLQQVEQSFSKDSLLNTVSNFATELHSQNFVKAMAAVQQQEAQQTAPAKRSPSPAEQSSQTDKNGNVQLAAQPNSKGIPETPSIPLNYNHPIELNKKTSMAMRGMQAMSLDDRSLNVLSRVAQRRQNPEQTKNRQSKMQSQNQTAETADTSSLGNLAEKFESAQKGSQVIGYDRNGGTSYGTYQLSSKAGTFDNFLKFLDKEEPEWAKTLRKAGRANTGSRSGAVPTAWKKLCAENPERMKELEHSFIVQSHYEPVLSYVQKKWNDKISPALKEVIFSTAVQHGVAGAKRVIDQALSRMPHQKNTSQAETEQKNNELLMAGFNAKTEKAATTKTTGKEGTKTSSAASSTQHQAEFIKNIYANRKNKFGSSTASVQQAARNRFVAEQKDALAMLG